MINFKCLRCGNCCKQRYVCIYYSELNKLEKLKNKTNKDINLIPFRYYVDKINEIIIDVIYRIDSKPCPFLKNNLCGIQNEKFISCKKFPIATWIDLGFFSKLGFNRLYFELDNHCSFLIKNKNYLNSIKKLKLEDIFKEEVYANLEDHKIWTLINSKIKKIVKEKKLDIIIDYKLRKKDSNYVNKILKKWSHKPVHVYFEEL